MTLLLLSQHEYLHLEHQIQRLGGTRALLSFLKQCLYPRIRSPDMRLRHNVDSVAGLARRLNIALASIYFRRHSRSHISYPSPPDK